MFFKLSILKKLSAGAKIVSKSYWIFCFKNDFYHGGEKSDEILFLQKNLQWLLLWRD